MKAACNLLSRRESLKLITVSSALAALELAGCRSQSTPEVTNTNFQGEFPIRATVTVGMVADLVRHVGDQQVTVTQLIGSGVDPHLYKPTPDDLRAILNSHIVFTNGLLLEGKMSEALKASSRSRPTCAVAESLLLPTQLSSGDAQHPDPHVWLDASLWSQATQVVADFLKQFDPLHAELYEQRASNLQLQLGQLHQYGQEIIASIPVERRVLVTSHDAFRYFGLAYGLEVQAIQGLSTDSEAGLQRINELVDLIVARRIEAVFVESSVPAKSTEALLEGAKARGQSIKIGGELYSDAMGPEGTYSGTYLGMMDHNLTTVARALGAANVPAQGFRSYHL